MIKQYGSIFIYRYSDTANILYNRITDPATGRSCYPDILVRHGFEEAGIEDSALYDSAVSMQRRYGVSNCFFLSAKDESVVDGFAGLTLAAYASCRTRPPMPDGAKLDRLCGALALSQTMRAAFGQLIQYYSLTADAETFMDAIYGRYRLPVRSKAEGKKIYEAIRTEILR